MFPSPFTETSSINISANSDSGIKVRGPLSPLSGVWSPFWTKIALIKVFISSLSKKSVLKASDVVLRSDGPTCKRLISTPPLSSHTGMLTGGLCFSSCRSGRRWWSWLDHDRTPWAIWTCSASLVLQPKDGWPGLLAALQFGGLAETRGGPHSWSGGLLLWRFTLLNSFMFF